MNRILLSTTNTLEGWEIKEYFGTVSANAVIGANVLSDIAASWTDFFGGRSGSYEKRLQQIYQQALSALEARAYDIGANCIVGLHIDIDEISGKGSQMFMITTYGTAVTAKRTAMADARGKGIKPSTAAEVNNRVTMLKLMKRTERGEKIIKYVDDIIENNAWELAEKVLDDLKRSIPPPGAASNNIKNYYNAALGMFANMPTDRASEVLYSRIIAEEDQRMTRYLAQIIKKINLIDYSRVPDMITSQSRMLIVNAMQTLAGLKQSYSADDSKRIENLLAVIDTHLPPRGSRIKKGLFNSKEKEVWECLCGAEHAIDVKYCSCGKDRYGYTKDSLDVMR